MRKGQVKRKYDAFLFFVLVALLLVFGVVSVSQIRMAQFNGKLTLIEDAVTRIEEKTDGFVHVMERYERALDFPKQQDEDIQVGIGDRKVAK